MKKIEQDEEFLPPPDAQSVERKRCMRGESAEVFLEKLK